MKKENRLLKNQDFKKVLDKKQSVSCGELVIYSKENELNMTRIGISVSSKLGNSVVRHKIKRQISEMVREIFDMNKNIDIVIIVRKKFLENSFFENSKVLKKMLFKISERG